MLRNCKIDLVDTSTGEIIYHSSKLVGFGLEYKNQAENFVQNHLDCLYRGLKQNRHLSILIDFTTQGIPYQQDLYPNNV